VSEDSGATPAPYVLDVSVLTAITRGDYGIMTFIQGLDASGQPLVIPALAIVAASLEPAVGRHGGHPARPRAARGAR
jgi:hypothetical protein